MCGTGSESQGAGYQFKVPNWLSKLETINCTVQTLKLIGTYKNINVLFKLSVNKVL